MRILVADFAGHPFQYELANELSRRGHEVTHSYCASLLTPQAAFDPTARPALAPIDFGRPFEKYSLVRRALDELRYGWRTAHLISSKRPDRVIVSNMPIISLAIVWFACTVCRIRWILWLQDIQSGLVALARGKLDLATLLFGTLERFLIRRAPGIVVISPEFELAVLSMGVRPHAVTMIENWAPLDQLPERPRVNAWAKSHSLDQVFTFLYSGTLGLKHSPHLLLALADEFSGEPDVRVVVVAEGAGADQLAATSRPNMVMLPFQPFDQLPDVMGSADVLVALLDPAAGGFSVPSKALTYLCAGRAILASIPAENAAARLIGDRASAGIVVDADDTEAFLAAARRLVEDSQLRRRLGSAARTYAEATFDRRRIAARFEEALN